MLQTTPSMIELLKKLSPILFLLTFGIILYALTLRGISGNPTPYYIKQTQNQPATAFESSHERGTYALLLSLTTNHSFSLSKSLVEISTPDVGFTNGKYFIYFPPGLAVIMLPFFFIGQNIQMAQLFTYSVVALFTTLSLILLYKIAREVLGLAVYSSLLASLVFGFASTSWSYAVTLYQHQITTFLALLSFYSVWKFRNAGGRSILWSLLVWLSYGVAISVDYPNTLLLLPIMIYFALSSFAVKTVHGRITITFKMLTLYTMIIFVGIAGLLGYYNYVNFGDWKRTNNTLISYENSLIQKNEEQTLQKNVNFKQLEAQKTPLSLFSEENLPRGLFTLLVAPDKGIFFFSPIFILALMGILMKPKRDTLERYILISLVVVNIFLYASFGDPWGGWAYGPRYLILSMAILSLFVAQWISYVNSQLLSRLITFILYGYSSFIALLGALTTNTVPPQQEAQLLHLEKYNFLLNINILTLGKSSSYIYNTYLKHLISLPLYFLSIYTTILVIVFTILFIIPRYNTNVWKQK